MLVGRWGRERGKYFKRTHQAMQMMIDHHLSKIPRTIRKFQSTLVQLLKLGFGESEVVILCQLMPRRLEFLPIPSAFTQHVVGRFNQSGQKCLQDGALLCTGFGYPDYHHTKPFRMIRRLE